MENTNCSASNLHSTDEVDYFEEEDLVFSALNLVVNFPEPPQKSYEKLSSFDQETCRIDDMIKKLGDIVIDEKDNEISDLKSHLENKNVQIAQFEDKLTNLVDFITFMHGRFGSLIESMLSMTRSGENESFLYFGPFNKARTKNEFIQILKDLSAKFLSDYENLVGTRELIEKANLILKKMEKATLKKKRNKIYAPNWNVPESENYNGGIQSTAFPVSSSQQEQHPNVTVSTTPPLNSTMGASPSTCPSIRRPPPSISRNSVQSDYGRNLASANKKHGVDLSKRHWGHFCLCGGTKFTSKASLMVHIKNFTVYKKFECNVCKKRFMFPSQLKAHLISSHKIESFIGGIVTCSFCQGKYRNYEEFCTHLEQYHCTKERVTFKQKPSKNGSDCEYHGEDITPAPTLESNATLTLHYANEDS